VGWSQKATLVLTIKKQKTPRRISDTLQFIPLVSADWQGQRCMQLLLDAFALKWTGTYFETVQLTVQLTFKKGVKVHYSVPTAETSL